MKKWLPCLIVLFVFLFAGLKEGPGYGISWDEGDQHYLGDLTLRYVTNRADTELFISGNKEYGSGFELPLAFMKARLKLTEQKDIYTFRHQALHVVFVLSALAIFILAFRLSGSNGAALFTMLAYLLSPRIYAHSFYNTKDIPFLCFLAVTLLVAHIAFQKDKLPYYVLLGCVAGYTTSIRIMGIMFFVLISVLFIADLISDYNNKRRLYKRVAFFLMFVVAYWLATYAFWPYIWYNPAGKIAGVFKTMAHYQWEGKMLLCGKELSGNNVPWWYMPVWFAITTPVAWLTAGLAGALWLITDILKQPTKYLTNTNDRNFLLYLLCFGGPVAAVVVLHSTVYDDWRHLYFIYVPFVLLIPYLANKVKATRLNLPLFAALLVQTAGCSYFLIKNHHAGYMYFNPIVSHKPEAIRNNYEMDYWGLSYRPALEYIAAYDKRPLIRIASGAKTPAIINLLILDTNDAKRFRYTTADKADYFLTNFRWHPADYTELDSLVPKIVYNQTLENSSVMRVYKLGAK